MRSAKPVVPPGVLLHAARSATDRFETASRTADSEATFIALFEALNWTVTLDERLGFGREAIFRGLRYARNAVHHNWADALELTPGRALPFKLPTILGDWSWRQDLPQPRNPRGRDEYRSELAGRPARLTLEAVVAILEERAAG